MAWPKSGRPVLSRQDATRAVLRGNFRNVGSAEKSGERTRPRVQSPASRRRPCSARRRTLHARTRRLPRAISRQFFSTILLEVHERRPRRNGLSPLSRHKANVYGHWPFLVDRPFRKILTRIALDPAHAGEKAWVASFSVPPSKEVRLMTPLATQHRRSCRD